jgi:hypothetical protein
MDILLETLFTYPLSTAIRGWLRFYATSRKVVGWIPDYVIGVFQFT